MKSTSKSRNSEELLRLPEAAAQLGVSLPTIKQWIYKEKLATVTTPGGHHRVSQEEVDRLLHKTKAKTKSPVGRSVSGRNQLVGRVVSVHFSGLMAEVTISIGEQQITSIITARSAREMNLKPGQTAAALMKSTDVMVLRV
jgi:molybdopterin-binding protein